MLPPVLVGQDSILSAAQVENLCYHFRDWVAQDCILCSAKCCAMPTRCKQVMMLPT